MLFHRTTVRLAAFLLSASMLGLSASADGGDLPTAAFGDGLKGACVTSTPRSGAVCLGQRIIRPGDVLTAQQLAQLTNSHPGSETDIQAVMGYLPLDAEGLGEEAELVFSIRGRKNEAPKAEDSGIETYKNLPNEGLLSVTDPEGEALTFTLTRPPRQGEVILREDGSFLYTPKKNKVCTDSFANTAAAPAGGGDPPGGWQLPLYPQKEQGRHRFLRLHRSGPGRQRLRRGHRHHHHPQAHR